MDFYRITQTVFHYAVLSFASFLMLIGLSQATVTLAQGPSIERLRYQVETLDTTVGAIPLEIRNLDRRLTVIETTLRNVEGSAVWNQLTMGGVGLLLARAVIDILARRRQNG